MTAAEPDPAVPRLVYDHVTKWYGTIAALMDVSFVVVSEVVGLVGKNGVGKSTLMKLAVGLLTPSLGEVRVVGATLGDDRCTVSVELESLEPVMQQRVSWTLRSEQGEPFAGELYHTLHRSRP